MHATDKFYQLEEGYAPVSKTACLPFVEIVNQSTYSGFEIILRFLKMQRCKFNLLSNQHNTVEPVYNGPVLSGHPLLIGQFLKSRLFAHRNAHVFVTCIRRPPLLRGRGHPVAVICLSFFVIFTCIKRPPLNGN